MAAATDLLSPARFGYLKPKDVARLAEAYRFSEAAHAGQTRQSGDPYISHPLAVAEILADWHLDGQTLMAALLHDVTEDTSVTKDEISDTFGKPVAELVDGVSKLDRIEFQSAEDAQAENFRKMLLAMARDVRVMLIKLADRLHNMRTLGAVSPAKRRRVARETMEIYAPIANRLGLNTLYHELQELAFSHLYPTRYKVLAKATKAARGNRREMIGRTLEAIKKKLADSGIQATVFGREKHVYSTYRKMIEKHLSFSEVHDIFGLRVIVADVPACYLALGALHGLYKPIPGKFKDYIAIPKANGYQSIHTDLIGPYGVPVEVQIRTEQMHRLAESGVASHWMYKDDADKLSELQKQTHRWLQSLLEIQHQSGDPQEFLEHVKVDLFPDEVYVFTPKGRILSLPRGATAVDFAYAVHTDIGNRCVAAKVNGELVPLRTELRNGDRVEIITASHAKPSPGWLQYVRTGKARSNIRHFLKTMQYEESAGPGRAAARPGAARAEELARRGRGRGLGARGARQRRALARGAARRHRPGQAAAGGGRAPAAAKTPIVNEGESGRQRHDPRHRGHGGAARHLLPADPGRRDRRLDQEGPGAGGARLRLRRQSCARARTSPSSGSTSSGTRAPRACSRRRSTSRWRTSAACSPRWPPRSPTPARTSTRSPWRTTAPCSPPCISSSR